MLIYQEIVFLYEIVKFDEQMRIVIEVKDEASM